MVKKLRKEAFNSGRPDREIGIGDKVVGGQSVKANRAPKFAASELPGSVAEITGRAIGLKKGGIAADERRLPGRSSKHS